MGLFAGLIRNESKAGGSNDARYSHVVIVSAEDQDEAHSKIDGYARRSGFVLENHHTGSPIYEAVQPPEPALTTLMMLRRFMERFTGNK